TEINSLVLQRPSFFFFSFIRNTKQRENAIVLYLPSLVSPPPSIHFYPSRFDWSPSPTMLPLLLVPLISTALLIAVCGKKKAPPPGTAGGPAPPGGPKQPSAPASDKNKDAPPEKKEEKKEEEKK
ncbi:hypothetical protein PENTCL1PPCAC_17836, partial [Pristionchus entomophagus]